MFKKNQYTPKYAIFYVLLLSLALMSSNGYAQETSEPVNISSAPSDAGTLSEDETTHPTLRITPDKSEIIRLKKDAKTIIVGNPSHLSALADTPTTLILVAKAPGATYFTVLDKDGEIIMQRHVIVASPKENYIRLRKSCASSEDDACQSTSVYYCPDMCHEVQIITKESKESNNSTNSGEAETTGQQNNMNNNAMDLEAGRN